MYKGFAALEETTGVSRGCRYLLLIACMLVVLPAWGAGVLVIGDSSRAYFRAFSSSLATSLGSSNVEITIVDRAAFDGDITNNSGYRCIVTVGNDAARQLSAKSFPVPVLHALVTESISHELYLKANGPTARSFLLIDQPISRLVLLANTSLAERHKLGVIFGPYSKRYRSEVHRQASNAEMLLTEKEISEPGQLGDVMTALSSSTDVVLILPDPMVVNEGTAKTLILGAYMGNLPLVGYSQALVKAGALMSVHSTPEQLGTQAGELIKSNYCSDTTQKESLIYPRYYQVSVNYQVANALQIDLPSESELKKRLEWMEGLR